MNYKEVIESRYNRQNWQLLLHDIFGSKVKFWNTPSKVSTSSQFARQALWLGTITLSDEQTISVYEVELSDKVDIERNRRGIRDMLLTSWRNNGNAGAFMFCYRKNESVLRFSYVSESWNFAEDGSYKKESTDTKRFTYLLGEGHRSRTAIQQFEKLRDSNLSLKDLTKAFSVDAVSDMFFDGYKKQYEDIIQYITGKRMVKVANKWEEQIKNKPCEEIMQEFAHFPNPEKAVRDYVKKLMGRLVFLQFLQKKGWLGVPVGAEWGTGDAEFIQTLFAQCHDKDHFIDNVLESLFNDLNSENEKQLPQYRTPYLNGGLFERDATDETEFPLPAKYMQSLLDFFASYNFTIDENDPDDAEVGVDPEMLGRIFENLLEDNKDKGAFYTPKEIVSYMCRESLIAYLQTDVDDKPTKEAIREFVITHDASTLGNIADDIDQRLKDVKICDPAIGSGAFPMGLLKELFLCRTALEGISQHQAAEIKKHIIQQNIYGVDIERGAVDIARLRFWLSLIVDEETPQALPNLDFKIMQGNSLLEQYKGVDLSTMTEKKYDMSAGLSWFDNMVDVYREELRSMLAKYYDCTDHEKKQSLRKEIIENVKKQLTEQSINVDFGDLDLSGNNQFMLWHTWFYDVFSQGGFDIVIGNPPYIQLQANEGLLANLYQNVGFETYNRTGDIFSLFYEQGWRLLKRKGLLCYITSNKWMRNDSGIETRCFFATQSNPMLVIDFAGLQLFENATVETNIILLAKEENRNSTFAVTTNNQCNNVLKNLELFVQENGAIMSFDNSDDWVILSLQEAAIQKKISEIALPLREKDIEINFGIKTGYNTAFIIDDNTRKAILDNCCDEEEKSLTNNLIVPVIRGRDTKRYIFNWANLWLINTHNGLQDGLPPVNIKKLPSIKKHLDHYWNRLSVRSDQGITPYNLRNCAYLREFTKPKIIWGEISDKSKFCYDEEGRFYCEATTFFMTGEISLFLLCYLNSKLSEYLFSKIATRTGMGTTRWKKYKIEKLPVPKVSKDFERKVEYLYHKYIETANEKWLNEIDKIIYALYNMTYDEVLIVDPETPITREEYIKDAT